jgi:hypothetical protein
LVVVHLPGFDSISLQSSSLQHEQTPPQPFLLWVDAIVEFPLRPKDRSRQEGEIDENKKESIVRITARPVKLKLEYCESRIITFEHSARSASVFDGLTNSRELAVPCDVVTRHDGGFAKSTTIRCMPARIMLPMLVTSSIHCVDDGGEDHKSPSPNQR